MASTDCSARSTGTKDKFEFVQVRHEEMAAFMAIAPTPSSPASSASAWRHQGPGASHLLTGLYDARMDHMPVLAIAGQQARTAVGAHYQQELDMASMFKDVAGAFTGYAMVPAQVRHLVDRAVRIALGERPRDRADISQRPAGPGDGAAAAQARRGVLRRRLVATQRSCRWTLTCARAAEVLNAGKKVAMLVGAGCEGRDRPGHRGSRQAGRGLRQGAARQGGAAR